MKFFGVLAAVGVLGMSAMTAQAANVSIDFTLSVDEVNHTWQAFASISGDTARTSGLGGASFNVIGAGGVVVFDPNIDPTTIDPVTNPTGDHFPGSINDMPQGFGPPGSIGFFSLNSGGDNGIAIEGGQSNTYKVTSSVKNILLGVGLAANTQSGITWGQPVQVAHGVYTGDVGSLTIVSEGVLTTLLPAVMPTATSAGANVSTFSADSVTGQTVLIGTSIPEPASLSLLALGGAALLTRRRKTKA